MNGDAIRFRVEAKDRRGEPLFFHAWHEDRAVWGEFEYRRLFWLRDEAEAVARYCQFGAVVIEQVA